MQAEVVEKLVSLREGIPRKDTKEVNIPNSLFWKMLGYNCSESHGFLNYGYETSNGEEFLN